MSYRRNLTLGDSYESYGLVHCMIIYIYYMNLKKQIMIDYFILSGIVCYLITIIV